MPGIPPNIISVRSEAFQDVETQINDWMNGNQASNLNTVKWTTHHWIHFIRSLPPSLTHSQMNELNRAFDFCKSKNAEIKSEWLLQVITRNYEPDITEIEFFLASQGRRKYVKLILTELARMPNGKERAREIY